MNSVYDPNTQKELVIPQTRASTLTTLAFYRFTDDKNDAIEWTSGQREIIDAILNRSSPDGLKRVEVIASTQYGKSLAVAAGIAIRASLYPEHWAIVAGTKEKARIIMEYVIMLSLNNPIIRSQLDPATPLDRLRMKKSADRLSFRRRGEVRVYSAEAGRVSETSKALMGFGSPNVVEDESALVPDKLQATVMRMLGGHKDNFLMKIGNPFNRNHFRKSWFSDRYYHIFIDYHRALVEGRYTQEFIDEMREEAMFDVMYACLFPSADRMDARGWLPLLTKEEVENAMVDDDYLFGDLKLGNDVAGGGRNYSVCVLRSYNLAKIVYKEHERDTMVFAGQIVSFKKRWAIRAKDVFIDKVGIGKGAFDRLKEIMAEVVGVSAGEQAQEIKRYSNLRAEMYWRAREWIVRGGKLLRDDDWLQLAEIRYKIADSSGRIKIMSKEDMLKEGIDSPDVADSLSLTFATADIPSSVRNNMAVATPPPNPDPYY